MKLVLAGATGMAGGEVLAQALADHSVERLTVLTRRPTGRAHPKLVEVVVPNFLDLSGIANELRDQDACIWALGVSQNDVNAEDYVRITYDYALIAARALLAANPGLRFCFLSGQGADQTEKSRFIFGRIKGRAEKDLASLSSSAVSFRPGWIRPPAGKPRRLIERLFAPIAAIGDPLTGGGMSVASEQLARCLIGVAREGSTQKILDNKAIRSWRSQKENA